jgi:serine/threonine protein kinase
MGEVWRARDTRLDRDVALKTLPADLVADADRLSRFSREAKVLAQLSHPGIAAIHAVEEIDGRRLLVMELAEGEDLSARMDRGPLPLDEALSIARQIAEALEEAHEKGIVHRDLKPGNIKLSADGRVKLLDFGLAKAWQGEPGPARDVTHSPTLTAQETKDGVILGTVGYMSPEQARGKPVDQRADIWAFGVVLFEMLSGRRLFEGETVSDILAAVLTKEPDWSTLPSGVPAGVVRLLRRCLVRDPRLRLRHVGDALLDLREEQAGLTGSGPVPAQGPASQASLTLQSSPPAPASAPPSRSSKTAFFAAGALALVMAAGAWLAGRLSPRENVLERATFDLKNYRYEAVFTARFLPDGQSLVYSSALVGSTPEVYIVRPEFPDPRPLGLPDTQLLSVSSKGELAVLLRPQYVRHRFFVGTLARVPVGGGAARELLGNVREADWGPDGESLAVIREVKGRDRLEYPMGKVLLESDGYLSDPRVSPDGKKVAVLQHPIRWDDRGLLAVVDLAGKRTVVSDGYSALQGITWAPDGKELLFTGSLGTEDNVVYATTLSGRRRTVLRAPGPLTFHDLAKDGRCLVAREIARYGFRGRRAGEREERELGWLNSDQPRLSGDGEKVLFMDDAPPWGDNYATGLREMRGGPAVRLGEGVPIAMSADGRWSLSMVPAAPGWLAVYPTGPGEARRLETGGLEKYSQTGSWFPDGKRVLFSGSAPGGASRCWVQSVDGGPPTAVTPDGTRDCRLSPDAKLLVARGEGDAWALYPLAGGAPRPLPGVEVGDFVNGFSADGTAVFATAGFGVPARVDRVEIATGKRSRLLELAPPDRAGILTIPDVELAKDGAAYAYSYHEIRSQLFLVNGLR